MEKRRKVTTSKSKKKDKKAKFGKLGIFKSILSFVFVIVTIIFYVSVVKMNLLPAGYITAFTVFETLLTFGLIIGFVKGHKKPLKNIIFLCIIVLVSAVYIYITNYAIATDEFLTNVFKEENQTEEYYVVVRSDSEYSKVEDISGKEIYTFKVEDDVKKEVEGKAKIEYKEEKNLLDLGNNLEEEKIDIILVSSVQYDMLNEEIKNFRQSTKIIYTASHEIKVDEAVDNPSSDIYNIDNSKFNIYISGIDTSGNINNVARSDANILATVNTKTHEILLTSIPRDYYVTLHTYGAKDKLTHSGIYGINETVQTVEDLLGVDINYYVRVNFTTVIRLVDTLGGIDVYSDYDFYSKLGFHFNKGINHLNGEQALVFSRERKSFLEGDNQRVKNQQHVIEAIIKKTLDGTTILTKYTNILDSLSGCFQTNIKQEEISKLVKDQLNDMSSWKITTNTLGGKSEYNYTYSMGNQSLYTMVPDAGSVESAKEKIKEILDKK